MRFRELLRLFNPHGDRTQIGGIPIRQWREWWKRSHA